MRSDLLRERLRTGEALLAQLASKNLRAFVEQAWPILEPGRPFLPNWHLDYIIEHLEAVTAGQITRLVINIPPRYMKSLLASVFWPTWEWIQFPERRWIFASYAETLAVKHSLDRRAVLQSPWYRSRFGDRCRLIGDQNEKAEYRNSRRGVMIATSVGASATGKGGDRIVVDDPHHPLQAESDAQRQQAIDYFQTSLSTRLDDQRHGAIVVVMQRLHTRDLSAICLEHHYTYVSLPAECESQTRVVFPRSQRVHVREVGDLLWPEREGHTEIAKQKALLGSYAFAGQYQQRPSPRGGGMFKRDWWQFFDEVPQFDEGAQSWDLAFKSGDQHDFVVGLVAGRRGANIYLLDRFKAHASFRETCWAMHNMTTRHPRASRIYVEDRANGPAVLDALRHDVAGLVAVEPEGGKYSRAAACEPRVEAGNVYLPRPTAPNGRAIPERAWVPDFIEQLAIFPKGEHDDDVDAFSQLLIQWARPHFSQELMDEIHKINEEAWEPSRWPKKL